jgi:electron transport complex protein RnfD
MKLVTSFGPYRRTKRSTFKIMLELLITLMVVYIAAIIYNFTLGAAYGVKAILMLLVSVAVTLLCDIFAAGVRYKKAKDGDFAKYLGQFLLGNYSIITAVILTLTLPIGTPYYVLIIGNILATLLMKHAFGGFGKNIVNPAVGARVILMLAFGSSLTATLGDASIGGLNAGATITSSYAMQEGAKWLGPGLPEANGLSMTDIWLGNYSAAIGETFTILILVIGLYLSIRKVINWRTPVFYFGTMALIAIPLALIAKVNVWTYLLLTFGLGGAVFGGVFMLTDPVTSPTSNFGKSLIGVIAAFLTMLIRVAGVYPEGVAISILFTNFLVPVIDYFTTGETNVHLWKKYVTTGVLAAVFIGTLAGVGSAKVRAAGPHDVPPTPVPAYKTFTGSYASEAPNEYAEAFTTEVEVDVDEEFNIIDLRATNYASPSTYLHDDELQTLVDYYTSIDVKAFKNLAPIVLPVGPGATTPAVDYSIPGKAYSSRAIYEAINDALKDISYYDGTHTSALCDADAMPDYCTDATLDVTVYTNDVDATIATLKLGEDGRSTDSFKKKWDDAYPEILKAYQDLDIATFMTYTDPAQVTTIDGTNLAAGLTYSNTRLFLAVQNALATYGG